MPAASDNTRERVLRAAAELLTEGGREAVSTRAVSTAAGVQAPTLYRHFGSMDGLLDAVAGYGFEEYLADKHAMERTDDPVADLRRGWDLHIGFGLARPAYYVLMYGDVRPGRVNRAADEATAILHELIGRIAAAGRLRMSVGHAARLAHSTGVGVVLTLIAAPPEERDPDLSATAREAVLRTITTDAPADGADTAAGPVARAQALKAALPADGGPLTAAERALLAEWLDRLSHPAAG